MVGIVYKLIIPGELPDLNRIIAASKQHYGQYSKLKKENTEFVAWIAKKLPVLSKINLKITWYCKDKRKDKDNISVGIKFILDGLVKAKVIKNDGWNEIGDFEYRFCVDKKNPRIEVEITEVEVE